MGIGLNAQQIKLVIDALRKGKPMKFSELKKLQFVNTGDEVTVYLFQSKKS